MKSTSYLIFFLFLLGVTNYATCSVVSRTDSGVPKKWEDQTVIPLYVHLNTFSHDTLSDADLLNKVLSISQKWAAYGNVYALPIESFSGPKTGQNDLYFSSSYPGLGSGVLGVTVTTTNEYSGNIIEADVIINSGTTYINNPDKLEDVLQHEMGHFFGLAHSPSAGATMFYQHVDGQASLAADDITGIAGKYPKNSFFTGGISGKIVGGPKAVGIFGAHVQAISENMGAVLGSTISDTSGNFEISGLPLSDNYYIYVSPLKELTPLPKYYSSVKNNFCEGGLSYSGGFFEGCNRRFEGHPQPIKVTSGTRNIGNVTIHCGLKVPSNYYEAKESGLALFADESVRYGESNVGYFTNVEVLGNIPDRYDLDLSSRTDLAGKKVRLNFLSHSLMSRLTFNVVVEDADGVTLSNKSVIAGQAIEDYKSDLAVTIELSSNSLLNVFSIKVTPSTNSIFNLDDAYGGQSDSRPFYFMSLYVTESSSATFGLASSAYQGGDNRVRLEDDLNCTDAPNSYSLVPAIDLSALNSSGDGDKKSIASCATIDLNGGNGGTGGGQALFVLGLFVILAISTKSHIKQT